MRHQTWLAAGFAILGVGALIVTLRSTGFLRASSPTVRGSPESSVQSASLDVLPDYSTLLTEESVPDIIADALDNWRERGHDRWLISLPPSQREMLVQEVAADLTMYLTGSWQRRKEWFERTGARNDYVANATDQAEAWKRLQSVWESTVEPIRLRPIDPNGLQVRPRFINGKSAGYYPEDALVVATFAGDHRFPGVAGDPEKNGATVIEVLLPIMYILNTTVEHAWFGIWYARDPTSGAWRILRTQIATYERPSKVGIVPTF